MPTPRSLGYAMPAEWSAHAAVWLAWPSHPELWEGALEPARDELVALCRALSGSAADGGETVHVLVLDERSEADAAARLAGAAVVLHRLPFGDIWLRDTGPIFVSDGDGRVAAVRFRFNGWGGKYRFRFDDEVAGGIARLGGVAGDALFEAPLVAEGGAFEVDGEGTCITTRACLLNDNRNPASDRAEVERVLREYLGVDEVVWLERGLAGDHTDGHVDTLARFAGPGRVLCAAARSGDDPNAEVLAEVAATLGRATDARGRRLEVVELPSPGRVLDVGGTPLPASYLNYYVSNETVVVPSYGSPYDSEAADIIAQCLPGRRTIVLSARHVLTGGGAFHCVTQQQPRARELTSGRATAVQSSR